MPRMKKKDTWWPPGDQGEDATKKIIDHYCPRIYKNNFVPRIN